MKYKKEDIICTCREVSLGEILFNIIERKADTIDKLCKLSDAGVCCKSCITKQNEIRSINPTGLYLDLIIQKVKNKNEKDTNK